MSADPVLSSTSILDRLALTGKNALVTGGNKGIGRAIAHAYAQAGANVAVIGRNHEDNLKVVAELNSLYKKIEAKAYSCDVTSENQVNQVMGQIVKDFGSLEIACNNAGIAEWIDAENMPFSNWQKMISNNLDSAFLCAKAQAKFMMQLGYGKILFTGNRFITQADYRKNQANAKQRSNELNDTRTQAERDNYDYYNS